MRCPLPPGKQGGHLIYNFWQRDDSPEAFYTTNSELLTALHTALVEPSAPPVTTPESLYLSFVLGR
jgi:predicted carbohydrate-binding protein with CBM5 and CBM33 domain